MNLIRYIGQVDREKVNELYGNSMVGMLLYQPANNHFEAQPIKMFEYMAAGLPVIASDFPLWKKIIEQNKCGICVDCQNPTEVKDAIIVLLNNPEESERMGRRGRNAIEKTYNWNTEGEKIISLYNEI